MQQENKYVPGRIDRFLLLWYKKYPSKDKIPFSVPEPMMKKVKDRARVHISLMMTGVAIVSYFFIALYSKRAAKKGESIEKMNEEFHKKYRESLLKKN